MVLWQCHEILSAGIYKIPQYHTMKPDGLSWLMENFKVWGSVTQQWPSTLTHGCSCWEQYLTASICSIPYVQLSHQSYCKLQQTSLETGKQVQKQIQAIQEILSTFELFLHKVTPGIWTTLAWLPERPVVIWTE